VQFVDSSQPALDICRAQLDLNGIEAERYELENADVFQWLGGRKEPDLDLIVLDPPALIKSKKHIEDGRKGYHFLNRAAMRALNNGGLLVTSSCSAFFPPEELRETMRKAAQQSGIRLHLLRGFTQGVDHPMALNFPESVYLQSYICQIER